MLDPSRQPTHDIDLTRVNTDAVRLLTRLLEKPKILPRRPEEDPDDH